MSITELYKFYSNSSGVSTDSRSILKDEIFFALKGENFDGHKYVDDVLSNGALLAVIDDENYAIDGKTFLVEDVLKALQELARHHRDQLKIPVIAITGSNGKTTTKELLYAVLDKKYNVHATKGNFNNHIGVPLTLLRAPLEAEILIIEMGANHVGDIHELCQIADPSYGMITNIGKAHLDGFGSVEGIIKGKTELYRHIAQRDGTLFLNDLDEILCNNLPENVRTVNYPNDISFDNSGLSLSFFKKDSNTIMTSQLYGQYNSINILAAIAIGRFFEVNDFNIFDAIQNYTPEINRSQILQLDNRTLILDAYNANPSSMLVSLESFINVSSQYEKILVLGDMMELGKEEVFLHKEILDFIKTEKFKHVFLVGPIFAQADKDKSYIHFKNVDLLLNYYAESTEDIFNKSMSLIKASRSIKLEKISEAIMARSNS